MKTRRLWTSVFALVSATGLGCGSEELPLEGIDLESAGVAEQKLDTVLNTFISDSIQIDLDGVGPGDADLYAAADPADGTGPVDLPTGGPGVFIDWDDLSSDLENHRLTDYNLPSGRDPTSFPGSNECVAESNVLDKMNLTYVASANNTEYAYLAVQRAANNGDAGYYWLFTKLEPELIPGGGPCRSDQEQLIYHVRAGDVLLGGHFQPSAVPLLQVYVANADATLTAVEAVDFTSGLWDLDPTGVAAAAVNSTVTDPNGFGVVDVKHTGLTDDGHLKEELFAEAAVPLSVFTSNSTPCDVTFYGSVITRASGSGGTTPDLKDLAGPALFNFGGTTAAAALTPQCGLNAGYELTSATGPDGNSIASPSCLWEFDDSTTSTDCDGMWMLAAAGTGHSASVTVTDPVSGCSDTVTTGTVDVYEDVAVTASMPDACALGFDYSATASGGSGGFTYDWSFSGPGTVTPSSSTSASGSATVSSAGTYTGGITVTDTRSDGPTCTATDSDTAALYAPLSVSLALTAAAESCSEEGGMTTDAVTYSASVGGGTGSQTLTWNGVSCSGGSCTIDPNDSTFCDSGTVSVSASDDAGLCPSATSETETFSKVTVVTASDN